MHQSDHIHYRVTNMKFSDSSTCSYYEEGTQRDMESELLKAGGHKQSDFVC